MCAKTFACVMQGCCGDDAAPLCPPLLLLMVDDISCREEDHRHRRPEMALAFNSPHASLNR